jgi:hypothetical protein
MFPGGSRCSICRLSGECHLPNRGPKRLSNDHDGIDCLELRIEPGPQMRCLTYVIIATDLMMDDLFEFLCMLLFEFRFTMAVLITLALGVFVSEVWPFGGDRTQVLNAFLGIAMLAGTSFWLYRQLMNPADK